MQAGKRRTSKMPQPSSELLAVAYLAANVHAIVKVTVAISGSRFEEKLE